MLIRTRFKNKLGMFSTGCFGGKASYLCHGRKYLSWVCCEDERGPRQDLLESSEGSTHQGPCLLLKRVQRGVMVPILFELTMQLVQVWETCSRTGADGLLSHFSALRDALHLANAFCI